MAKNNKPDSLESITKSCDEAEVLLKSLEIKEEQKESTTYTYEESQEKEVIKRGLKSNEPWQSDFNSVGNKIFALAGLIIFIVVIAGIAEERRQNVVAGGGDNKSTSTAPFWKYKKALKTSSNAVLVSEHRNAIKEIKEVLDLGLNSSTMNRDLLNNRIIQARKAIKYIDQKGEDKYDEYSDYGMQWYDEGERSSHKLFFTYSKMCKQPLISFEYKRGKGGPVIGRTTRVPTSNISTILIPHGTQPNTWLYVTDFRCN